MKIIESIKNNRGLRENLILRTIFAPPYKIKRILEHRAYIRSEDSNKLKGYKNIHSGERCFVIGNGPSLTPEDLDKLKNEYSFASNHIYKIFDRTNWRPTYYVSVDKAWLEKEWPFVTFSG